MSPDMVAELLRQLMKESMLLAAPLLVAAAALSFVLSLVQTLTSLQVQSLTSVPRLLAVALILLAGMPWFLGTHGRLHAHIADGPAALPGMREAGTREQGLRDYKR